MTEQEQKLIERSSRCIFSPEQNNFLTYLVIQLSLIKSSKFKWKKIAEHFNLMFPNNHRAAKYLKNHYNNVLNPQLLRNPISGTEREIALRYFHQYGCQYRKIAGFMGRTENSVKNYFNKELLKTLPPEEIEYFRKITQEDKNQKTEKVPQTEKIHQVPINKTSQITEQKQILPTCQSIPTIVQKTISIHPISSLDDYESQRNRWFSLEKSCGFWED